VDSIRKKKQEEEDFRASIIRAQNVRADKGGFGGRWRLGG
jgi:hypothetical protein